MDQLGEVTPLAEGVVVTRFNLPTRGGEIAAEWLGNSSFNEKRVILYLHGGGYSVGSCRSHRGFVSHIGLRSRANVLLPEYRLAPENQYPAGLEDALDAYGWLLSEGYTPENIILAGDSAGGGLCLATMLHLREEKRPLPAAAILLSPWTDLAGTGGSLQSRAACDPWLQPENIVQAGERYAGKAGVTHPLVSPHYADLSGLPPMLIQVGDCEILLDDARRLYEKAKGAGVDAFLDVWNGMWHVWQAFIRLGVPESQQAIAQIGLYAQTQFGRLHQSEAQTAV